jgi:catechol 2,3-dioxygenase-like lactoylglutathione lyase family enzyme
MNKIGHITLLVDDVDKALDFYVSKLNFKKVDDLTMPNGYRWLTVAPQSQQEIALVFVVADSPDKIQRIGSQTAGHVFMTLQTDDIHRDYVAFKNKGVTFFGEPREMPWGTEVVLEDCYGNRFDLVQVK